MNRLVFMIFALTPAFAQLPAWLESYPGTTPSVRSTESLIESSYTIAAQPADIVEHYRKLFEAAGLPFRPNFDGIGTSIKASAPECDLLIQIRTREAGTFVAVNCSTKTQSGAPSLPTDVKVISGQPKASPVYPSSHPMIPEDMMERHRRIAAEMGIHRVHPDAPAPPLVWPAWLVQVGGAAPRTTRTVNYAKDDMLKAQYTTNAPMTEIYQFYRELLSSHEYPTRSKMSTGHTQSGIQQNAMGSVEGSNYPDGAPGAYSEIRVSFDRQVLNGPITVSMYFTTHEFVSKRGY